MLGVRAVALGARLVDGSHLDHLRSLQPVLHKLYDAVAKDVDFLTSAIRSRMPPCAWQEKELQVLHQTAEHSLRKPRLLLPNSIYLQKAANESVLTVGNVQAGEPYHVEALREQLLQQPGLTTTVEVGPLHAHCAAIASAARLVHPSAPCVAILSKPPDALAERTRTDVRGVGSTLQCDYGIDTVLYVSMRDLADAVVETDGSGDLRLGEHRISVVYSRYDFSHPFGRPVPRESAASVLAQGGPQRGAVGGDSSIGAGRLRELWEEWETIANMERSRAIVSSDLGCRLAHRRSVTYALQQPGGVERFLCEPADVAAVRGVLPEQWSLRSGDAESARCVTDLVRSDADRLVAKNVLRPRTGSGPTQDRLHSGGAPVVSADGLRALLHEDEGSREWYLLYRKLAPLTHSAVVRDVGGSVHSIDEVTSEIAVYGAFLSLAGERDPRINVCAGVAARTRPVDAMHPLTAGLGYGALSCVEASR